MGTWLGWMRWWGLCIASSWGVGIQDDDAVAHDLWENTDGGVAGTGLGCWYGVCEFCFPEGILGFVVWSLVVNAIREWHD